MDKDEVSKGLNRSSGDGKKVADVRYSENNLYLE